ncbi:MAG: helix-turn-helix transcriptional regulator [Verrucomicrobiae bacterium]|nr:helix-turn-helix transcriptional regulator [Verrucomicrobiae bacterium]
MQKQFMTGPLLTESMLYNGAMKPKAHRPPLDQHIASLREAAGLSQAQLAHLVGVHHSNIGFWEVSGTAPRGEVLPKLAKALGVSVDEFLKVESKPKKSVAKGRLQKIFEAASKLPRRQQEKVADVLEAFVSQQSNKAA